MQNKTLELEQYIKIMRDFKVIQCQNAKPHDPQNCFYYHSIDNDRRRPHLDLLNYGILYSNFLDFTPSHSIQTLNDPTQLLFDNNDPSSNTSNHEYFAKNLNEYNYHIENYKKKMCGYELYNGHCDLVYCPYIHQGEKLEAFQNFRIDCLKKLTYIADPFFEMMNSNEELLDEDDDFTNFPQICPVIPPIGQAGASIKYIVGETTNLHEDNVTEFKHWKTVQVHNIKFKLEIIEQYICAFLNSNGGSLYIGITDEGKIQGLIISRKIRDLILLEIDNQLKNFKPMLNSSDVQVLFHPVGYQSMRGQILPIRDRYIIEIKVVKGKFDEIYFSTKQEVYQRMRASNMKLETIQITNLLKDKLLKNNNNQ